MTTPFDPASDLGLATTLADRLRDDLLWLTGLGWLRREGPYWEPAPQALALISEEVSAQARVLMTTPSPPSPRRIATLESAAVASAVEKLLRGKLAEDASVFDADPEELNCPNGVVNLRTGVLRDHRPTDRFLHCTAVSFVAGHTSEHWSAALRSVQEEVADWLALRLGQATTGQPPPDDVVLFLIGSGDNGKTTLIDAVVTALGGYAAMVSERVLLASEGAHPTELMDLLGLRVAILEELPGGRHLNMNRLKALAGTQMIKARRMRQDSAEFLVSHALVVTSNYRPKIVETDHGSWRRPAFVPFPFRFVTDPLDETVERRKDPALRAALRAGDPAVLAWLVDGARRALADPMAHSRWPTPVREFSDQVRAENDLITGFLSETVESSPDGVVSTLALYLNFAEWMGQRGRKVPDITGFSERLGEVMPELTKARRRVGGKPQMCWLGLAWMDQRSENITLRGLPGGSV